MPGSSRSSLTLETEEREPAGHPIAKKRKICAICPSAKRRMTKSTCYEGRLISPRPKFFRNLRLRTRWSKNGLAYFNKDESCEDDPRPGRPVTVVTEENVRKIEKLVLAERRIKLWQIAEELQISKERVG
ncbi:Putative uncharacterized protein FLJ37770 [Eumeta japonica]|uniref:Histone-lysine N-methyltransferase SETMAR n=1 Tax=Eumeta variegata TaxID=151549 RepID=A0A4C1V5I1_EUMVA|nr:Putative uncharacterized protein FLJ37770 [Eumeta japonica]